jgi:hypothetical protein
MRFHVSYLQLSLVCRSAWATTEKIPSIEIRAGSAAMATSQSPSTASEDVLGGGAINEKERNVNELNPPEPVKSGGSFDPSNHRSHLWHALEGLDRYPSYLSRWQEDDMVELEKALEKQLQKVRDQKKTVLDRRQGIHTMMKHLDPKYVLSIPQNWDEVRDMLDPIAAKAIFKSTWYQQEPPSVHDVLSGKSQVDLDAHLLEGLMEQELFDVYSMPLLSRAFCDKLRHFVQAVSKLGETAEFADLIVGKRPIDLDTVGLSWINNLLFHLIIRPVARHLYKDSETIDELDWRQGYVAGYSAKPASSDATPRQRLVSHTDDSEVTLNLCIGDDFDGGALQFRGLRGSDDGGQLIGDFQPIQGTALIHAGRHLHEVTEVTRGNRYAFIIWARSWKGTRRQSCPCCWLNRRQDDACVCGRRWN